MLPTVCWELFLIVSSSAMAEASPSGNYLVRVCAQVMTRDDSKGGWVPMGGGGLSNVSVRKKPLKTPSEDDAKYEYLIFGKRITDQTVVLSCTIKKDFQYNKVMPTFHHWKTGDKKFGLTFQTAADARAFDRGVRQAVEDLLDGNIHSPLKYNLDVAEEDVFMALDLPMERGADSRSSSGSSTNGGSVGVIGGGRPPSTTPSVNAEPNSSSPYTHPHANHHHLHRMHYISKTPRTNTPNSNGSSTNSQNGNTLAGSEQRSKEHEDIWIKHEEKPNNKKLQGFDNDKIEVIQDESLSSYVEFTKQRNRPSVHEYSYPVVDALKMDKRDSITSFKKHNSEMKPPLLPTKTKKKKDRKKEKHKHLLLDRSRCRHCHEMFNEDDNERGSCEFAPDGIRSCINAVTCISCAQCMLYHCMSDAEGDYNHHPCSCNISDENCKKRWIGLTLLSFFVPCLWCYLPLRACHKCGVSCGICGGRHEAT